ncbi:hypothetical protein C7B69_04345 [filamentous cyanobacterium Phorm 46]|nr:hypothetical protein C7B69_04345 [filamentous cyanobacterium Phorm 46]PSB53106.1 hypothetical protein C7B67_04400 [filamentous cyanobacterium Phorm 6]
MGAIGFLQLSYPKLAIFRRIRSSICEKPQSERALPTDAVPDALLTLLNPVYRSQSVAQITQFTLTNRVSASRPGSQKM